MAFIIVPDNGDYLIMANGTVLFMVAAEPELSENADYTEDDYGMIGRLSTMENR